MINSLLITHNARLRCFITKLFNNSNISNDIIKKKQFKDYRWQNCCVLKLLLIPNSSTFKKFNFELSLIYDGEIDSSENKHGYQYWGNTKKSENSQTIFNLFEVLNGSINLIDLIDVNIKNIEHIDLKNINNEFTFYLVRHGQGIHNLYNKKTIFRKKDTSLTNTGKNQAINAGFVINNHLDNKSIIDYYFASDLLRTRQTFSNILKGIKANNLTFSKMPNIINLLILPCSHELPFVTNGKCDSTKNISKIFSSENKMSCVKLNKYTYKNSKYTDCVNFNTKTSDNIDISVNIDWSFYYDFYGTYRENKTKFRKKQCRNTSMLEESIKYISSKQNLLKDNNKISNKLSKKISTKLKY